MRWRPSFSTGSALRLTVSLLATVLLGTSGTGSIAGAATVTPAAGYGFSEGSWMLDLSPADLNRELDAVAATRATWLRVLIDWSKAEPQKGQYSWDAFDRIVNAASARGLRVLGNIAFTPEWARPPQSFFTSPPVDPATFADFSKAVVGRYGSRISDWEIWNEPNLGLFFGWQDNRVNTYTGILKAAYPAIKSVQPSSTVIAAGLSRSGGGDAPPAFLDAMYEAGAKDYFDAAAAHPYVFPGGLSADTENGWSDVGRMRDVMVARGDGGKKIWMTELGAPTSAPSAEGVSPDQQARDITELLGAIAALDYAGPTFIYSIRDNDSGNRGDRESNFGALLTSDWKVKPTAAALAR